MSTRINVITVSSNDLDGLRETIKSVDAQTYKNILHIIIDAGTTNFQEILNMERIKNTIYVSEPDDGIYDGMNKGLLHCEEGVVCWLNSADSYTDNDILEKVARSYSKKNWDWAYGAMKFKQQGREKEVINWQYPFNLNLLALGIRWIPHESSFYQTRLVSLIQKYDESIHIASDQDFILRAAKVALPEYLPFVCVTMQPGGTHTTLKAFQREKIWQDIRRKNGLLLLKSPWADNIFVALSPLVSRIFYLHRDTLNRFTIKRKLKLE